MSTSGVDRSRVGWVDGPSFRGTWDILWQCLVTTFICTYTLLCLNIPAPKDSVWTLFRRRALWMVLAVLGPEIVLTYAAGQWSGARHSVAAFQRSGYSQWSMRMAFFADMGGFVLQPRDGEPFPLNAKQLHWLVVNGHAEYPALRPEDVWDKSKQDRLSKGITAVQIAYVVIECSGRAMQNLAITTLELNTLGIVLIEEITEHRQWRTTPLDFVDENGPGWSLNVQPFMKMPVIPPQRPIQRIPNDRFPMNPYGVQEYCVCFATLLFAGIHVGGWNFSFPSRLEQILWRTASLLLFGVTAAFWVLETMASWVRLGRWKWIYLKLVDPDRLPEFEKAREERRRATDMREPALFPLPWEFWSIVPVALLDGISRLYLLVEAFLELRSVDASAFVNVSWSEYLPHI
ncbi:hypothetical protein CONLIGDRAFT_582658 [Coniochaeta ligniaria NRRL 30616]|uniref:Uncharacterized protein n=1 Tax=Coniochaeta ligniaria NRRL 30616 TaxID=1408157 RepID=A0A1J7IDJ0_9PEZI|nr:hypothetical protein CONLIGDRAFT_582658 [Coniochaeta ligniaria NRRL 30616]